MGGTRAVLANNSIQSEDAKEGQNQVFSHCQDIIMKVTELGTQSETLESACTLQSTTSAGVRVLGLTQQGPCLRDGARTL